MILIIFFVLARLATPVPTETYYIEEPQDYDEIAEDSWMDPHSPLTTSTTTTISTTISAPKCQKVCKRLCPTTTTTTSKPGKLINY